MSWAAGAAAMAMSVSLGAALTRSSPLTLGMVEPARSTATRPTSLRRRWIASARVREVGRITSALAAGILVVSSPVLMIVLTAMVGGSLAARRRARRRADLALAETEAIDAITMLDVCLSAGLGLRESVVELDRLTGGPVWGSPASALARGVSFDEVMARLGADRPALSRPATAMARAHRDGASVRAIVRGHRDDLVSRRRADLTERSQRLGVLVLLPLTTCILPALVLAVVVPIAADGFTGLSFPY